MIDGLDTFLFHLANDWCGNRKIDLIVAYAEGEDLFRGGLMLAVYWYFWFAASPQREERRRLIVATVIGTVAALALSRTAAMALPFRIRPMYEAGIGYHSPSIPIQFNFENWSSFPSDTATYFFALASGVYAFSRPLSLVLMAYSAVWICLPRLFVGLHYPSDLFVGALIGVGCVWASQTRGGQRAAGPVLRAEQSRPGLFYAAMFMLSYEMATIFEDVRHVIRGIAHYVLVPGGVTAGENAVLLVAGMMLLAVIVGLALVRRRAIRSERSARGDAQAVRVGEAMRHGAEPPR